MPVLTPDACRNSLAQFIKAIEKTGQVHTYRRIVRDELSLQQHFWDQVNGRICGWMISPAPSNPAIPVVNPGFSGHGVKGGGNVITTFQFQIEGIFGLDDAGESEKVFYDLAWAVVDELNAYGSIPDVAGGKIPGLDRQLPASIEQFGFIMFAGAPLCHYTRLEVGFIGRTRG